MKLDRRFYVWATSAAWTTASAAQAYANEDSTRTLSHYITSSLISADPIVMVMIGVGLIALRVIMTKRSKRREKDQAQSLRTESAEFTAIK